MRSRPPQPTNVEDFIAGEETTLASKQTGESVAVERKDGRRRPSKRMPWEESSVRDDVIKAFNLRLSEPYMLKLRFISENTPQSMQQWCMSVLLPEIDRKINELTDSKT